MVEFFAKTDIVTEVSIILLNLSCSILSAYKVPKIEINAKIAERISMTYILFV